MRLPGTPIACANWFWLRPISLRNSCLRISPGWGLASSSVPPFATEALGLVVVGDLDIGCISVAPDETEAPLVIYSDAHLSGSISGQSFKPVSWRISQIIHRSRGIELTELAQGTILNLPRQSSAHQSLPNGFR